MREPLRTEVPGDKSLTHRALIFGALASGRCTVRHPLNSEDTRSTARVLRALGVPIDTPDEGPWCIQGRGGRFDPPVAPLDCGNSGTTARLMVGVLAGSGTPAVLTGDESLQRRPSRRVTAPLRMMGAEIRDLRDSFPVEIIGGVRSGIDYASPVASAQVKSAVLLAGLVGGVPVRYREPRLSRDHTERLLGALGRPLEVDHGALRLEPGAPVPPFDYRVPGDPSSAAFVVAGALVTGLRSVRVDDVCLNPTRCGFLDVLKRMGAEVASVVEQTRHGEPVGYLTVVPTGTLRATVVPAAEVPGVIDEIPVLAVLAARAQGETRFEGVGELRVKESDRLGQLVANLRRLGVEAEAPGDDLVVRGPMKGPVAARVESAGDHRIAMAFAALGLAADIDVELSETQSPEVSFPGFQRALDAIHAA